MGLLLVTYVLRLRSDSGPRWAVSTAPDAPAAWVDPDWSLAAWLSGSVGPPVATEDVRLPASALAPLDDQPVWAAGVTYLRSRDARMEESEVKDVYDRVYEAERPELFLKALPGDSRGPDEPVSIRPDSTWDVPEPELVVIGDHAGEVRAWSLGNDMSSRSIEGENPLYLPQAKVWEGSCSVGPALRLAADPEEWRDWTLSLAITRGADTVYADTVEVGTMKRSPAELLRWLARGVRMPAGVALLTGTSIVPDSTVTLLPGDLVTITSDDLGVLANPVVDLATMLEHQ